MSIADTAALVAARMVDLWVREQLVERLDAAQRAILAGRRLDVIAETLAEIALDADNAADTYGGIERTPAPETRPHPRPTFPPTTATPCPPSRAERLRARALSLIDAGAPVLDAKAQLELPLIAEADATELDRWEWLVLHLEVEHTDAGRPFGLDWITEAAA